MEWDERRGGDLVWCEPYQRFAPRHNTLYLFRVHEGSMHFVQPIARNSMIDADSNTRSADGGRKRLAVNGWFVLDDYSASSGKDGGTLESRLDEAGHASHRKLLQTVTRDDFVHHHHHVGGASINDAAPNAVGAAESSDAPKKTVRYMAVD